MLIGYVSDENYLALSDVQVEFLRDGELVAVTRSTPSGAVYAEIEPGEHNVTLARDGFGSKRVTMTFDPLVPYQFRLLSERILGYMWHKWVRAGEKSEYRIHSPEECRVTLWRYGLEKELVRILNWHGEHSPRASVQVTPDGDYSQGGVEWNRVGYVSSQHSQHVIAPERSGLYYIHLEGKSGAEFSFPWVVAPNESSAPIAVLASTNTWNAYNNFGGRSNYINPNGLPPVPAVNVRRENPRYRANVMREFFPQNACPPLSFERPEPFNHIALATRVTDPIRGRNESHLAPTEWRLLGWLEREGYSYDLYADYQLHDGTLQLDAFKILILNTHPEYWSGEMYYRVKEWVFERGGKLMYLGGDGIDGPIEFLGDAAMRHSNPFENVDISGANPEGTEEIRFDVPFESPAKLLGVVLTTEGIMSGAPFRVFDESHWVFEGTGLKNGDLFGIESLHERAHGGASGHETDKISRSSPKDLAHLAKGINPDNGGSDMVYHETTSGGAVFSVGSITYPACLLVDANLSQVTRNVIERFLA